MDRFSTSFPLSSELPLHGGLSQHDLSVRISRSRGVLRCAYSTYAFRDVGPSVFSFDRLKDPSFCFMPLPFPESQALNTHSVEFSSRLPSSPSIKSDSAKRSYPPSSALSCRITSDTDLRLIVEPRSWLQILDINSRRPPRLWKSSLWLVAIPFRRLIEAEHEE